jgi:hypothetical protein
MNSKHIAGPDERSDSLTTFQLGNVFRTGGI